TERRRKIQTDYNIKNNITPTSIVKDVRDVLEITSNDTKTVVDGKKLSKREKQDLVARLTKEMKHAALLLEFEYAATLRDRISKLEKEK
ncbi:MAG: UvrB/UvrC motif-containing protein, partial [Oscillospiraceae bacterium]